MAMNYLPRCHCGGHPAVVVTSAGSQIVCLKCKQSTRRRRRQARVVEEWREMQRAAQGVGQEVA